MAGIVENDKSAPGLTHWGDITVVVIYFVLVLAVGLWVSVMTENSGDKNKIKNEQFFVSVISIVPVCPVDF